jgi:hypothetical protein
VEGMDLRPLELRRCCGNQPPGAVHPTTAEVRPFVQHASPRSKSDLGTTCRQG